MKLTPASNSAWAIHRPITVPNCVHIAHGSSKLVVPHDIGDELRQCEKQADDDGQARTPPDENLVAARCSFSGADLGRRAIRTGKDLSEALEPDREVVSPSVSTLRMIGSSFDLPVGTVRTFRRIRTGEPYIEKTCFQPTDGRRTRQANDS